MNISSTPFIRNDYWPDYNDINELNKRIDETENEISLVNIRLSADIENVSNNLNSYINNQANTTIANNIIVNSLNANYAEGKFANFTNTNTDNAYIENLTVNKPVFDITLNTPHIENTTSLGGNFYNTNLIDPKFSGDASGDFNTVNVDIINANTANIGNLFVNTQPEPVTSSAVLGYDSEGRVIPVHAAYDASFPENASYLFTDSHGTAFAGTAATEVSETNNLITSFAVKNALDDYANTVNESFNLVNNALGDIDSWQNNLENNIANSFNDVNNGFNDVNNFVNNGFNDVNNFVNNGFNDVNNFVNNGFNDVNNFVNNGFNDVNNGFNDVNNFVNNGFNDINANVQSVYDILNNALGLNLQLNYINSTSPVNYQNVQRVVFTTGQIGNVWCNTSGKMGTQYYDWNPSTNTLTFSSMSGIVTFNTDMRDAFYDCKSLNQNILIPNSVKDMSGAFADCKSLNQNILIPNSVEYITEAFVGCTSLNQNILIPNSVEDMRSAFGDCTSLNQNIYIYSENIGDDFSIESAFLGCTLLTDKYIHIRSSIPMDTSNNTYNSLVNYSTGIDWTGRVVNDLEEPTQWPPV